MSRREKSTVLYSRNGIKIERIDYLDMDKPANSKYANMCVKETFSSTLKKKELVKGKDAWVEKFKHTSPLGFYYYTEIHHYKEEDKLITDSAKFVRYVGSFGTTRYEFTYPTSFNDMSISRETRPWDLLPGYKGIPEHFITDLYKEIIKMLNVFESERIPFRYKEGSSYWDNHGYRKIAPEFSEDMGWIETCRKKIFKDIFGDENGPSVNYNDIKILSHGFDIKESFRKRKEE